MSRLIDIYDRLLMAYGRQDWWPGETPFEVMVGAILTQNTAWTNVERAIDNLKEAELLEPHPLYELAEEELAELIRPAGYFRVKAKRLRNLLALLVEQYDGSVEAMAKTDLPTLREELLSVNGVGPETADSILLYAFEKPSFVIDAYTYRVLTRHGLIGFDANYHAMQACFEEQLPSDVAMFNEYHALLVTVGKRHCSKRNPKCESCPLRELLPVNGPLTPEG